MKFEYVKFKNFLSYGEELTTLPLNDPGVWLVLGENQKDDGSNGAGKSAAAIDSIVYALFGRTTKKIKADSIINNINRKDCYVELSFYIGKDHYVIRRYRGHSEFGNDLFFEKNGKSSDADGKRDVQKVIEDTIKMSYNSFILAIVLSQEKISNFAEQDSIDRRRIVERLLMYDFISKYHKASKEIVRKINPEMITNQNSHKDKKETIETLTENLISYVENWEHTIGQKKQRIEALQNEIKEWETLDIEEELTNRAKVGEIESETNNLLEKVESLEEKVFDLKSRERDEHKDLQVVEEEIAEITEQPDKCPVCGSNIKDSQFQKYLNEKLEICKNLKRSLRSHSRKVAKAEEEISSLKSQIDQNKTVAKQLKKLIKVEFSVNDLSDIRKKVTEISSEISLLEEEIQKDVENDDYVKTSQQKINLVKKDAKKLRKKLKELEEEKEYYIWWKDALSNSPNSMKTFCINHILTSLNKYINFYLDFFGYDLKYTLSEELEDLIIKDGVDISFGQLSGGEKRSVELSLVFALYEVIRLKMPEVINIICLDELLSMRLDDVRIGGVIEILNELKERGLSIFVIEHKNYLKENLDCRIINVTKNKQGFSSLEIV
jgi:DNA repair exonuclease SbcCD ATPase subunit